MAVATFKDCTLAKVKLADGLLVDENIMGVGVGYADPLQPTNGAALLIYVRGTASTEITAHYATTVDMMLQGRQVSIPIRFVAAQPFVCNDSRSVAALVTRVRPVPAGYSVGHGGNAGTSGLTLMGKDSPGRLYLCSNNHVLNQDNSAGLSRTLQPGGADGGKQERDSIGRLYRFVRLQKDGNLLDAAICLPSSRRLLAARYAALGKVAGHFRRYRVGWKLRKVGRSTGLVHGVVESVNVDMKVDYGDYGGLGVVIFRNQSVIKGEQPVSMPGDSGSIWLRGTRNYAVAVNYAGTVDGLRSIAFPVHWVMQVFATRVARRRNRRGRVVAAGRRGSLLYTRSLTATELRHLAKSFGRARSI